MKVAVVYLGIFPTEVGMPAGERRMLDIARGLHMQPNCKVTILSPRRPGTPARREFDGLEDVCYLGKEGSGLMARLSFWRNVRRYCKSKSIDWVLGYGTTVDGIWTFWRLRHAGIKIVGEFCDLRSTGDGGSPIARLGFHFDEKILPRMTDLNIVISSTIEKHVQKQAFKTPCLRLPVLVDERTFNLVENANEIALDQWNIPLESIVFGYVGGLWKSEGVATLVRAFKEVVEEIPEAKLIVAGRLEKSSAFDDVEGMRVELGLEENLILSGWVSTSDVRTIYTRADVMVLPQLGDAFSSAALPTKLAEYCCMSKAILATDVGDVPLYVPHDHGARIVPDGDVEAMAVEMLALAKDRELRQRLASYANEIAQTQFNSRQAMQNVALKMLEISGNETVSTTA